MISTRVENFLSCGEEFLVARTIKELPKAEWVIMEALWSRGHATATDLQNDLDASDGWAYSTVKTMLDRLVNKGFVKTRRLGHIYEYSPRLPRQTAVARVVNEEVDRVLEGSLTPFVDRLLAQRKLSQAEAIELRSLIDRYTEPAE
jgi:predicted transcriptional regulator